MLLYNFIIMFLVGFFKRRAEKRQEFYEQPVVLISGTWSFNIRNVEFTIQHFESDRFLTDRGVVTVHIFFAKTP